MSLLYRNAASVLSKLLQRKAGLKTLTYSGDVTDRHKRPAYALVCETVRFKPVLQKLIYASNMGAAIRKMNKAIVLVMLYDQLFGHGIRGGGAVKRVIKQYEPALRRALASMRSAAGLDDSAPNDALLPPDARRDATVRRDARVPRFARVNTALTSTANVLQYLEQHNVSAAAAPGADAAQTEKTSKIPGKDGLHAQTHERDASVVSRLPQATVDPLINDLLVFPAGTELHEHDLVKNGALVLQDKASCMPAQALTEDLDLQAELVGASAASATTRGGGHASGDVRCQVDAIDACAAPGNKTSHLAALMSSMLPDMTADSHSGKCRGGSRGRVFAIDRSNERLDMLRSRVTRMGLMPNSRAKAKATLTSAVAAQVAPAPTVHISPRCADFLQLDPRHPDFANVRLVLLDPSCSGTGMVQHAHLDSMGSDADNGDAAGSAAAERLSALSRFQLSALCHALKFAQARRISYSTCSIRRQENEDVVAAALHAMRQTSCREGGAMFALRRCLPKWSRRGIAGPPPGAPEAPSLTPAEADCVVRVEPQDGMHGFFVAVFERVDHSTFDDASVPGPTTATVGSSSDANAAKRRRRRDKEKEKRRARKRERDEINASGNAGKGESSREAGASRLTEAQRQRKKRKMRALKERQRQRKLVGEDLQH